MIVMKFGGTSLQDALCIRRAVEIVAQHRNQQPVVVVSNQDIPEVVIKLHREFFVREVPDSVFADASGDVYP